MLKFLIWCVGCIAFVIAIDRLHIWHALVSVAVCFSGLMWIIGGAAMLGHGLDERARERAGQRSVADLRQQQARKADSAELGKLP